MAVKHQEGSHGTCPWAQRPVPVDQLAHHRESPEYLWMDLCQKRTLRSTGVCVCVFVSSVYIYIYIIHISYIYIYYYIYYIILYHDVVWYIGNRMAQEVWFKVSDAPVTMVYWPQMGVLWSSQLRRYATLTVWPCFTRRHLCPRFMKLDNVGMARKPPQRLKISKPTSRWVGGTSPRGLKQGTVALYPLTPLATIFIHFPHENAVVFPDMVFPKKTSFLDKIHIPSGKLT